MFFNIRKLINEKLNNSIERKVMLLSDDDLTKKIDVCYQREEIFNTKRNIEVKHICIMEFYRRKTMKQERLAKAS